MCVLMTAHISIFTCNTGTLERKLGIFFLAYLMAHSVYLCLPPGSVLFVYLPTRSLICHQSGYTGDSMCTQLIITSAWFSERQHTMELVIVWLKEKSPVGGCWEIFLHFASASKEELHIRERLNYTVLNKDPAEGTWRFDGCGKQKQWIK